MNRIEVQNSLYFKYKSLINGFTDAFDQFKESLLNKNKILTLKGAIEWKTVFTLAYLEYDNNNDNN